MRHILVVDRHTRSAIDIWLKQCGFRDAITDGGESGPAALDDGMFELMKGPAAFAALVHPDEAAEITGTHT